MPRYLSPQVQPIFLSKKDADAALEQLPAGHGAKLEVTLTLTLTLTLAQTLALTLTLTTDPEHGP